MTKGLAKAQRSVGIKPNLKMNRGRYAPLMISRINNGHKDFLEKGDQERDGQRRGIISISQMYLIVEIQKYSRNCGNLVIFT